MFFSTFFKKRHLHMFFIFIFIFIPFKTRAEHYHFDNELLSSGYHSTDLSAFETEGQLPGIYLVDILLNDTHIESRKIMFNKIKNNGGHEMLYPCLSSSLLKTYGVSVNKIRNFYEKKKCAIFPANTDIKIHFNFSTQTLSLNMPQIYLKNNAKTQIPYEFWDDGIPAMMLGWKTSAQRTQNITGREQNVEHATYLQLSPGINIGAWRLRNMLTWNKNNQGRPKWNSTYTYLERGLNSLKSRIIIGEKNTPADIFDSIPFRGMMINSDENMISHYQSRYSPIVQGIARTQARVEVKQNGYTIYNETVSPGPFAISDFTPLSSGGELDVTIWESTGKPQKFKVPYQTAAISIKEGYVKYSTALGHHRSIGIKEKDSKIGQATIMYGLPWDITIYGGMQLANNYYATSLGSGISLGYLGAVSVDTTRSHFMADTSQHGQTWRLRYNNEFPTTSTSLSLAYNHHPSKGYMTLTEALNSLAQRQQTPPWNRKSMQSRLSIFAGQSLGNYGYLSVGGYNDFNKNNNGSNSSIYAGYSMLIGTTTVSFNWSENKKHYGRHEMLDRISSLSFSIPLGKGTHHAIYRYTSSSNEGRASEVGFNGSLLNERLWWDTREHLKANDKNKNQDNGILNLTWFGHHGIWGGHYSYNHTSRQLGINASGGIVLHSNGITFGQQLEDTMALIDTPGISGVNINGWPGVSTDSYGSTTLGGMTPYQKNHIQLDSSELPVDAELMQTSTVVIPTKGSVVKAEFSTRIGGKGLISLILPDGTPVPFGATVTVGEKGPFTGITGNSGIVYLTGLPKQSVLNVHWREGGCRAKYKLPKNRNSQGLYEIKSICREHY